MLRALSGLFNRPGFHEPVVDGVRAIAILWVFLLHIVFFHIGAFPDRVLDIFNGTFTQWIGQGDLGVDIFFVISGYLIGTILLKELRRTHRIDMRRFYGRRFLRLIPVYAIAMGLGVYFLRNIPKSAILMDIAPSGNIEYAWTNLLYVNNFVTISKQYMCWCWSLAIEEQFYAIVPFFLLMVVGRSKRPLVWMLVLLFMSGLIRLAIICGYGIVPPFNDTPDIPDWSLRFDAIYDKLHMRYGGLLAGVIGAYCSLFHTDAVVRFFSNSFRTTVIGLISLMLFGAIAILSFGEEWFASLPRLFSQVIHSHFCDVFSIAVLFIMLIAIHGCGVLARVMNQLLSTRILYPISQLSYSIYLLHEMFMLWLFPKTTPWLVDSFGFGPNAVMVVNGISVTVLTLAASAFLYVTVERPCMDYRKSPLFCRLFAPTDLLPAQDTVQ